MLIIYICSKLGFWRNNFESSFVIWPAANMGICKSWAGRKYNQQQFVYNLQFGQDKHCSTVILNFNKVKSRAAVRGGHKPISQPSQYTRALAAIIEDLI